MAKKGQKFNSYTSEFKQRILDQWINGFKTPNLLARENGISPKTIETWIRKLKRPEEYLSVGYKRGRLKDSEIDWKERYQILKKYQVFLKAQRERK